MSVSESYLSEVHQKTKDEKQSGLSEYTNDDIENGLGTTIAVVSDPTGGILDVCDEYIPDLGMPIDLLNEFRERRSELNLDNDVERHNKAAQLVGLEEKYINYLENDEKAMRHIEELVRRVEEGEAITLVCFERKPKWCHRHILKDVILDKVNGN